MEVTASDANDADIQTRPKSRGVVAISDGSLFGLRLIIYCNPRTPPIEHCRSVGTRPTIVEMLDTPTYTECKSFVFN